MCLLACALAGLRACVLLFVCLFDRVFVYFFVRAWLLVCLFACSCFRLFVCLLDCFLCECACLLCGCDCWIVCLLAGVRVNVCVCYLFAF